MFLREMIEQGYWKIGRFRGVPVRMHLLVPLGALFFSGFRFEPGAWVGFVLLVFLHEMGHALAVKRFGLHVEGIDLHAYGGVCRWSGQATAWERALIAWGGVAMQAVVLGVTYAALALVGPPRSAFVAELAYVLTVTNLWMIGLNLVPFPPFDGATAWQIVPMLRARFGAKSSSHSFSDRPAGRAGWGEPARDAGWQGEIRVRRPVEDAPASRPSRPFAGSRWDVRTWFGKPKAPQVSPEEALRIARAFEDAVRPRR